MEFKDKVRRKVEFKDKVRRVQELGNIKMCDASRHEHEEFWRLLKEIANETLAQIKEEVK